jgi:glycosyltransferase involved in cell wall biosynthesis
MRINCVFGPFLPVPPVRGGAVERIFLALCNEWVRLGHDVTIVSRAYRGFPKRECVQKVSYIRISSFDAPRNRILYRICDLIYAARASSKLQKADITITHSVSLPLIIPRRVAGCIYVSVARYPKGHMWIYRHVDRLQTVSSHIEKAIGRQTPSVARLARTIPNCISLEFSEAIRDERGPRRKEIVFVGRIAREKGIDILLRAFKAISRNHLDWRLVIIGPHEIKQGGDGTNYLTKLKALCSQNSDRIDFAGPVFDEAELIERLRAAEIFVYPSIAAKGEALPLAPLEAMACGCAVVLSSLDCFRDYLAAGENALRFDHTDSSGGSLATALETLIGSKELRDSTALNAIATARNYTPSSIASRFIEDFVALLEQKGLSAGAST